MTIYIAVEAVTTEESTTQNDAAWLKSSDVSTKSEGEQASDWGTGFANWEVKLKP